MNKDIKLIEEAYRRGFAQGYQIGIETQPEDMDDLKKRIQKWRYEKENIKGAPGTSFENIEMYDFEKLNSKSEN